MINLRDSRIVNGFEGFTAMLDNMVQPARHSVFTQDNWIYPVTTMEEIHAEYFQQNTGPDGLRWPELHPITVMQKGSSEILVDQRFLIESLTTSGTAAGIREFGGQTLVFGTRREWAWQHQEGHGRIPQRMHTGLSADNLDRVVDAVADEIVKQMFSA